MHSGHIVPHGKQQITAQELAWTLRRRRAQVEACHESSEKQEEEYGNVRVLGSCQHVMSEIGMHTAQWCVCLSVCPGRMSGDAVSAGIMVMCIRLTPSVEVKQ